MSWTDLSEKLIQKVVENLGLTSRHCLRCTNRQNRSIVDSMEYFIPRLKVSVTKSKYTIVFFKQVGKWTKIEISRGKEKKTMTTFSFESDETPSYSTSTLSSQLPCDKAVAILAELFSQKWVLIGTLEWDICVEGENEDLINQRQEAVTKLLVQKLQKLTGKEHLFRVNYTYSISCSKHIDNTLLEMCFHKDYVGLKKLIRPMPAVTTAVLDSVIQVANCDKDVNFYSHYYHRQTEDTIQLVYRVAAISEAIIVLKFTNFDDDAKKNWDLLDFEVHRKDGHCYKVYKTATDPMLRCVFTSSSCGYWFHAFSQKNIEKYGADKFFEYVTSIKCGLGHLCQKCDPFGYWYFQNFHRWNSLAPKSDDVTKKEDVKKAVPVGKTNDVTKKEEDVVTASSDDVTKKMSKMCPKVAKLYARCVSVSEKTQLIYNHLDTTLEELSAEPLFLKQNFEDICELKKKSEEFKRVDRLTRQWADKLKFDVQNSNGFSAEYSKIAAEVDELLKDSVDIDKVDEEIKKLGLDKMPENRKKSDDVIEKPEVEKVPKNRKMSESKEKIPEPDDVIVQKLAKICPSAAEIYKKVDEASKMFEAGSEFLNTFAEESKLIPKIQKNPEMANHIAHAQKLSISFKGMRQRMETALWNARMILKTNPEGVKSMELPDNFCEAIQKSKAILKKFGWVENPEDVEKEDETPVIDDVTIENLAKSNSDVAQLLSALRMSKSGSEFLDNLLEKMNQLGAEFREIPSFSEQVSKIEKLSAILKDLYQGFETSLKKLRRVDADFLAEHLELPDWFAEVTLDAKSALESYGWVENWENVKKEVESSEEIPSPDDVIIQKLSKISPKLVDVYKEVFKRSQNCKSIFTKMENYVDQLGTIPGIEENQHFAQEFADARKESIEYRGHHQNFEKILIEMDSWDEKTSEDDIRIRKVILEAIKAVDGLEDVEESDESSDDFKNVPEDVPKIQKTPESDVNKKNGQNFFQTPVIDDVTIENLAKSNSDVAQLLSASKMCKSGSEFLNDLLEKMSQISELREIPSYSEQVSQIEKISASLKELYQSLESGLKKLRTVNVEFLAENLELPVWFAEASFDSKTVLESYGWVENWEHVKKEDKSSEEISSSDDVIIQKLSKMSPEFVDIYKNVFSESQNEIRKVILEAKKAVSGLEDVKESDEDDFTNVSENVPEIQMTSESDVYKKIGQKMIETSGDVKKRAAASGEVRHRKMRQVTENEQVHKKCVKTPEVRQSTEAEEKPKPGNFYIFHLHKIHPLVKEVYEKFIYSSNQYKKTYEGIDAAIKESETIRGLDRLPEYVEVKASSVEESKEYKMRHEKIEAILKKLRVLAENVAENNSLPDDYGVVVKEAMDLWKLYGLAEDAKKEETDDNSEDVAYDPDGAKNPDGFNIHMKGIKINEEMDSEVDFKRWIVLSIFMISFFCAVYCMFYFFLLF